MHIENWGGEPLEKGVWLTVAAVKARRWDKVFGRIVLRRCDTLLRSSLKIDSLINEGTFGRCPPTYRLSPYVSVGRFLLCSRPAFFSSSFSFLVVGNQGVKHATAHFPC